MSMSSPDISSENVASPKSERHNASDRRNSWWWPFGKRRRLEPSASSPALPLRQSDHLKDQSAAAQPSSPTTYAPPSPIHRSYESDSETDASSRPSAARQGPQTEAQQEGDDELEIQEALVISEFSSTQPSSSFGDSPAQNLRFLPPFPALDVYVKRHLTWLRDPALLLLPEHIIEDDWFDLMLEELDDNRENVQRLMHVNPYELFQFIVKEYGDTLDMVCARISVSFSKRN